MLLHNDNSEFLPLLFDYCAVDLHSLGLWYFSVYSIDQSQNGCDSRYPDLLFVSEEQHHGATKRMLLFLMSPLGFESLAGTSPNRHFLRTMLLRWRSFGFPHPQFRTLGLCLSEWLPEFERFLRSCERRDAVTDSCPLASDTSTAFPHTS